MVRIKNHQYFGWETKNLGLVCAILAVRLNEGHKESFWDHKEKTSSYVQGHNMRFWVQVKDRWEARRRGQGEVQPVYRITTAAVLMANPMQAGL